MANKSGKKTTRTWLFRMDRKKAAEIEIHLKNSGIKQGPFFASAALEKIARDTAQRTAA